jgi:hypothetical protein
VSSGGVDSSSPLVLPDDHHGEAIKDRRLYRRQSLGLYTLRLPVLTVASCDRALSRAGRGRRARARGESIELTDACALHLLAHSRFLILLPQDDDEEADDGSEEDVKPAKKVAAKKAEAKTSKGKDAGEKKPAAKVRLPIVHDVFGADFHALDDEQKAKREDDEAVKVEKNDDGESFIEVSPTSTVDPYYRRTD